MAKNRKKDKYNSIIKILSVMIFVSALVVAFLLVYVNYDRFFEKQVTCLVPDTSYSQIITTSDPEDTDIPAAIYTESTVTEKTDAVTGKAEIITPEPDNTTQDAAITEKTTEKETVSVVEKPTDNGRVIVDMNESPWNLVIVNAKREIPEGYEPQLEEILGSGKYLDYRVAPYYEKMYYAAKKEGVTLTPYSAYRSYERQKINYENLTDTYMSRYGISRDEAAKKAATVILPPGTSEHNLGLAVDICNTLNSFANTKEYKWLSEHAHEYGFILRYTAEKQPVTGIVPEPWHWRYVGPEYAKEIRDSGLCLEEWTAKRAETGVE